MATGLPLIYHPDYDVPEWNEEHRFPLSKFRLYKILSEEEFGFGRFIGLRLRRSII